jgi:hypothetical protein
MKRAVMAVCVIACMACGSSGGGATPEAAVRAMSDAVVRGDMAGVKRALVAPGRLRAALSCTGHDNVITTLEASLDALHDAPEVIQGVTVETRSIEETGHRSLAKGDLYRGCTATEPFEVRMLAVDKRTGKGGAYDDSEETMDVVRLDGRWYLMPQ